MANDDVILAGAVADAAVFILNGWRSDQFALDAQIVHHLFSLTADLGLPQNDPLVDRVNKNIALARDAEREVGLYTLALAKLDRLESAHVEMLLHRLDMSSATISIQSFGTAFGRDILERLLCIEALILAKPLLGREKVAVLRQHLQTTDKELESYDAKERSYVVMLWAILDGKKRQREIRKCFEKLCDQIKDVKADLWYKESLCFNSLVLLNGLRAEPALGKRFCRQLWDMTFPRLRELARNLLPLDSAKPFMLAQHPGIFVDLVPYVRALCYSPDKTLSPVLSRLLSEGSAAAHDRALQSFAMAERVLRRREQSLVSGLQQAIVGSLVMSADISYLSGGLSSSRIGVAVLHIRQPFQTYGQSIVFKTDDQKLLLKETELHSKLERIGLGALFAAVASAKPQVVDIEGQPTSILIYEHLADFVTLRTILSAPAPQKDKIDTIKIVAEALAKIYGTNVQDNACDCKNIWTSIIENILKTVAKLLPSNAPKLRRNILDVCTVTQKVLQDLEVYTGHKVTIMHGDLNCRNIMVRQRSPVDCRDAVKLIDYETLKFRGDLLIDIGELIEDMFLASAFLQNDEVVQTVLWDVMVASLPWLTEEPLVEERLLLARIRSSSMLCLINLDKTPAFAQRALERWRQAIEMLRAQRLRPTKR